MKRTIALFAFLGGVVTADLTNPYGSDLQDWIQGVEPSSALCGTDTECAELCPEGTRDLSPDDPDYCDGGPQPEPKQQLALPLSCWAAKSHIRCEVL